MGLVESRSRFSLLFAHDLFGKPLRTFPDHALTVDASSCTTGKSCMLCMRKLPVVPIRRGGDILIYRNKLDSDPKSHA
jgi:hypothetical protein